MNKKILTLASVIAIFLVQIASAQILVNYTNFDSTAPTFGGEWNEIYTDDNFQALLDLNGDSTDVTLSFGGDSFVQAITDQGSWDHGNVDWIDEDATNSYFANSAGNSSEVIFDGLIENGFYRFDHLAVRDAGAGRIADFTIDGAFADSTPNGDDFDHQLDGWDPGNYLTWNNAQADENGQLILTVDNVVGFGYLSASRLTSVPEPTALFVLSAFGFAATLRRRRSCEG